MDVLENADYKQSIITLQDFPFICRICCLKRSDLRLFEEEDYLFDLFHAIRKIDVRSTVEFPKNVCNGCISELEDISLFIDITKYNNPSIGKNMQPKTECTDEIKSGMSRNLKVIEENGEDMFARGAQICRICLSLASSPTPFEEKTHLIQLFENITNIDAKTELNNTKMYGICNNCNNQLEKISSFLTSSLCNDQKLEHVIGGYKTVDTENYSNPTDIELSTRQELKLQNVGRNEAMTGNNAEEISLFHESKVKLEIIDIKEDIIDSTLITSTDHGVNLITQCVKSLNHFDQFICSCCQKSFANEWNLQQHLFMPTEGKLFKCASCHKSFTRKSNLQSHLLTYTGKITFQCATCEKRFCWKRSLQRHKCTHTAKKLFKCNSCEKSFTCKTDLQHHLLTHTGKKTFKCGTCEKCYSWKCSLQRHKRNHTAQKLFSTKTIH